MHGATPVHRTEAGFFAGSAEPNPRRELCKQLTRQPDHDSFASGSAHPNFRRKYPLDNMIPNLLSGTNDSAVDDRVGFVGFDTDGLEAKGCGRPRLSLHRRALRSTAPGERITQRTCRRSFDP
jgi:hypothetical protein